jgi:hypothetical protein
MQQAYLKAQNTDSEDYFGTSLAIDGNALAIGAPFEDSSSDDPSNNSAVDSGAVYIFTRTGSSWFARAYVKASNPGSGDRFGVSTNLVGRGLLVGADREDSSGRGLNGAPDESAEKAGAAYFFIGENATWSEMFYIKASNTNADDRFGSGVALSERALVVVAPKEQSAATEINPGENAENDNSANNAGAAYVFE